MVHVEWRWDSLCFQGVSREPPPCWTLSAPYPVPREVCWSGQEEQWEGSEVVHLRADCGIEGKKASFLEKSMGR